jgi:dipeptidyl-peptidase-4
VAFLRSSAGDDPVNDLWVVDVAAGAERKLADARALLGGDEEHLPAAERARRERTREAAGGVVAYTADPDLTLAAFALGGRLFVANVAAGSVRELPDATGPVFDPRPDPSGSSIAYLSDRSLRLIDLDGTGGADGARDREIAGEDDPDVSWGAAEFVAAEEMGRHRGFWWSPDGASLIAARVDISGVQRWHIGDPSDPAALPRTLAYPAAGTPNADVRLFVLDPTAATRTEIEWDREAFPYLVDVHWSNAGRPLLLVQSRDQRRMRVMSVDPSTGTVAVLRDDDDDAWLEIVPGVPAWTAAGALVSTADSGDTRRLLIDGRAVTPTGVQVREVLDVRDGVLFAASEDPSEQHV